MAKRGERGLTRKMERRETRLSFGVATERSEKHPENEDGWLVDEQLQLAAVFDGLGGLRKGTEYQGSLAARTAADAVQAFFRQAPEPHSLEELKQQMDSALDCMNRAVCSRRMETGRLLGTTAVVFKSAIVGDRRIGMIGSIGDSRAMRYLLGRPNRLEILTVDDADWVLKYQTYEERIRIQTRFADIVSDADLQGLSEQESRDFFWYRLGSLYRYLGADPQVGGSVIGFEMLPRERYLFATDGLTDVLPHSRIREMVTQFRKPEELSAQLVSKARSYKHTPASIYLRAKNDDTTVVVVDVH